MSKTVDYRGYTISSTPLHLSGKNEWKPEIEISTEREGVVTAEPYTDETTYTTEETADTYGIKLGQDIIDGKVRELSEN
jgi:hypothetical protein